MKPCASHRERLALLACGLCPADETRDLQDHLRSCPGCREHFRQLSAVCHHHTTAADQLPEARVPARLFHHVARRIRSGSEADEPRERRGQFPGWGSLVGWAALGLALLIPAIQWSRPSPEPKAPDLTQIRPPAPASRIERAEPPANSLLAYRLALNRSPEALEQLLSEEMARPSPAPQIALRTVTELLEFEL